MVGLKPGKSVLNTQAGAEGVSGDESFFGSRPTEGSPEGRRAFSADFSGFKPQSMLQACRHPGVVDDVCQGH